MIDVVKWAIYQKSVLLYLENLIHLKEINYRLQMYNVKNKLASFHHISAKRANAKGNPQHSPKRMMKLADGIKFYNLLTNLDTIQSQITIKLVISNITNMQKWFEYLIRI